LGALEHQASRQDYSTHRARRSGDFIGHAEWFLQSQTVCYHPRLFRVLWNVFCPRTCRPCGNRRQPMPPRTRYAKCGDISIAYQTLGDGPTDLVYAQGWLSHIEFAWED
jgi:hypothetical protein